MRGALLSMGSESSLMTLEAMKKYFDKVDGIDIRNVEVMLGRNDLSILYNGKKLHKYDGIYAKGSFRYAPLLRALTTYFYSKVYMPIKPNAFTIGHDKLLTHLALQYNKIPMPDTYIVSSIAAAKKILGQISFPIILKFPHGTQGKGVMFADSYAAASSMLDTVETLRNPFLIQEFVESDDSDIRTFVIGERVVASMKRKAEFGEKRANIHAGAKGEPIVLGEYARKIAVRTAKVIGAEICAVDMLETVKGPMVIETNLSPGLQEITKVTKVDIADKIAKYLFDRSKDFSEKGKTTETSKLFEEMGIKGTDAKQIVANVDFRSDRILLPKIITNITKFDEGDEVVVKAAKGKVTLERL